MARRPPMSDPILTFERRLTALEANCGGNEARERDLRVELTNVKKQLDRLHAVLRVAGRLAATAAADEPPDEPHAGLVPSSRGVEPRGGPRTNRDGHDDVAHLGPNVRDPQPPPPPTHQHSELAERFHALEARFVDEQDAYAAFEAAAGYAASEAAADAEPDRLRAELVSP